MRKSADVYRCAATRWMDEGGHAKLLEKCSLDLQEALDEIEIIRFWGGDLKAADREIRKRRLLPAVSQFDFFWFSAVSADSRDPDLPFLMGSGPTGSLMPSILTNMGYNINLIFGQARHRPHLRGNLPGTDPISGAISPAWP